MRQQPMAALQETLPFQASVEASPSALGPSRWGARCHTRHEHRLEFHEAISPVPAAPHAQVLQAVCFRPVAIRQRQDNRPPNPMGRPATWQEQVQACYVATSGAVHGPLVGVVLEQPADDLSQRCAKRSHGITCIQRQRHVVDSLGVICHLAKDGAEPTIDLVHLTQDVKDRSARVCPTSSALLPGIARSAIGADDALLAPEHLRHLQLPEERRFHRSSVEALGGVAA